MPEQFGLFDQRDAGGDQTAAPLGVGDAGVGNSAAETVGTVLQRIGLGLVEGDVSEPVAGVLQRHLLGNSGMVAVETATTELRALVNRE